MEIQKNIKTVVTYKTSKESGKITFIRKNNESAAAIRTAMINEIEFIFDRFAIQDGKVAIKVNLNQLSKCISYVPNIDKSVMLQLPSFSTLEAMYSNFSITTYSNENVESGFGFEIKDTKYNWDKVNKYGASFLINGMNEDLLTSVFSKLEGFKITTAIHPLY